MQLEQKRRAYRGDDNIVPMINIVFLLLIFFLLAGTLSPRPPFELEYVTTTQQSPEEAPANGLYISTAGVLFHNGKTVELSELASVLGRNAGQQAEAIDLVADRRVEALLLYPLLDALSKAGFAKVRIVTERKSEN